MNDYSDLKFVMYCRKSTEGEDRQVESIADQKKVLSPISEQKELDVVTTISDKKTAKQPGREGFNKMIEMIERGEANAILTWKINRLARNPVDEGRIKWLLQKGIIKRIITPHREYLPTDNVIITSIEFGEANQRSIEIGVDVKRRYTEKAKSGDLPTGKKLGYVWDIMAKQGEKTLLPDGSEERYTKLQKAIKAVANGKYNPLQALEALNKDWNFTTPKSDKLGGRPMHRSKWYSLLHDPFYAGSFEYPKNSGEWHEGNHAKMISKEEYDKIQIILGSDKRPKPSKNKLPYTGMMTCGECSASITAELKWQCICTYCKHKFSCRHTNVCTKCDTTIDEMNKPTIMKFTYYRCTKKKGPCSQKTIEVKQLEKQVDDFLSKIMISERFQTWAVKKLNEENKSEIDERKRKLRALQNQYDDSIERISNLTNLRISPDNVDGDLLSNEEYLEQKKKLLERKNQIKSQMNKFDSRVNEWTELAEKTFNFSRYARHWFAQGDVNQKRAIMRSIGLNLVLQDRTWRVEAPSPFLLFKDIAEKVPSTAARLEPSHSKTTASKKRDLEKLWDRSPSVQGWRESNSHQPLWRRLSCH
jgi:site-specific DNA recombinase